MTAASPGSPESRGFQEPGDGFVRRRLNRQRMLSLLDEFEREAARVTDTVYVPGPAAGEHRRRVDVRGWEGLPPSAAESPAGLVLISGPGLKVAVAPPFPPAESAHAPGQPDHADGPHFAPLRAVLTARRVVAILLLRLGAYAVGVADDGRLIASKTGSRYVHGRHRAGGQSQRRFERNREAWMMKLFDEACEVARSRLAPYEGNLDALALGGDRHVLHAFMERCPYLGRMAQRLHTIQVPVDRPGLAALRTACEGAWSSDVWSGSSTSSHWYA